ncbi:MFS transporter [Klebsiella pneumoniae subsp. pneumoniae]|nr:MFS transporter [Klebsiella pneumoniae subsp. pneumoniae]
MFLVTRLVDGVADVLMGLVIDNHHHPLGALPPLAADRRPAFWPAVYSGLYVPDFDTTGKLLYAFVTYLCLSFLYTLVNIPFCAMLPFLTSDSAERTTAVGGAHFAGLPWRHHRRRGYAAAGRHARQRQPAAGIPSIPR